MNSYNKERVSFIKLLNTALQPMTNFDYMEYKVNENTGGEYIRLYDAIGNANYLDVTGFDAEQVLVNIMATILGNKTACRVIEYEECVKLSRLFKEG